MAPPKGAAAKGAYSATNGRARPDVAPQGTLRQLEGVCDWCQSAVHPNVEICVALQCQRCTDGLVYHQACVEKYLKKGGYESNRKVGFPCPYGRGTKSTGPECRGRIEKSHPIIPKNELKKKARLVAPVAAAAPAAPGANGAAAVAQQQQQQQKKQPPLPSLNGGGGARKGMVSTQGAMRGIAQQIRAQHGWQQQQGGGLQQRRPPQGDYDNNNNNNGGECQEEQEEEEEEQGPRVPVGLELAVGEALSKAQRKNAARAKKRQEQQSSAAGSDTTSLTGGAAGGDEAGGNGAHPTAAFGSAPAMLLPGSRPPLPPASVPAGAAPAVPLPGSTAAAAALLSSRHFVTSIERYQMLIGAYVGGGDENDNGSNAESSNPSLTLSAVGSGGAFVESSADSYTNNDSGAIAAAIAPVAANGDDDADMRAAIEASLRDSQLSLEAARQRQILATGGGFAAHARIPVAVPVAVPVAAPVVEAAAGPCEAPPALPWGAPAPAAAPPAAQVQQEPPAAAAAAAGDDDDDDDDLDSILAYCGVDDVSVRS